VEPSEAIFNRVSSQEPARTTVRILGVGAEPLQITSHKLTHAPSAPYFRLEFKPLGPTDFPPKSEYQSGVEMQVELKPGLPLGQLAQTIQITTNRNPGGTFDIPVYGTVVSDISLVGLGASAEKMSVDLGSFASRQGAKSTVYVVVEGPPRSNHIRSPPSNRCRIDGDPGRTDSREPANRQLPSDLGSAARHMPSAAFRPAAGWRCAKLPIRGEGLTFQSNMRSSIDGFVNVGPVTRHG
jgi:hypothetical protein